MCSSFPFFPSFPPYSVPINSPSIHAGFRAFNWNRHHPYKRFLERPDKKTFGKEFIE